MKRMNRRARVTLPCGTQLETEQDDDRECPTKYAELLNADKIQFLRVKCYNKINETISTDFHAIVSKKVGMDAMSRIARERFQSENSYNVMLIAVDSTSRLNSIRRFQRRGHLIMSNELEAVEMLGFTRVGASSLPNVYALLTGLDSKQLRVNLFSMVPLHLEELLEARVLDLIRGRRSCFYECVHLRPEWIPNNSN